MDIRNNDANQAMFMQDVNQFAHLDRLIKDAKKSMKPYQDQIKQWKKEKSELEQGVYNTMTANKIPIAQATDAGVELETVVKKSMIPMTQKVVKEKMISYFENGPGNDISFNSKGSQQKGLELFDYIYGKKNREMKTKEHLKMKELR